MAGKRKRRRKTIIAGVQSPRSASPLEQAERSPWKFLRKSSGRVIGCVISKHMRQVALRCGATAYRISIQYPLIVDHSLGGCSRPATQESFRLLLPGLPIPASMQTQRPNGHAEQFHRTCRRRILCSLGRSRFIDSIRLTRMILTSVIMSWSNDSPLSHAGSPVSKRRMLKS
jgi:hypothetical protein